MNENIEARIEQMPRPAQMYYAQLIEQADGDVLGAISALRESQSDGSIPTELKPAANLAMVKMVAHMNGDSKPRQMNSAEAQADIKQRIEEARLAGDRKTYDALTAAQAHGAAKAEKAEALMQKRKAMSEASFEALCEKKRDLYETLKTSFKDAELNLLARGGLTPEQAEAQFNLLSAAGVEQAAQAGSGYSPPREPIEE